jgi:predicted small integral membrane protein
MHLSVLWEETNRAPVCSLAIAVRSVKIFMVGSLFLFALLVAWNNVVDYDTNAAFVRHTLSMDTTFPGNRLMGRAMAEPAIWTAAYCAIIAVEASIAALLGIGAIQLAVNLKQPAARFNAAKGLATIGLGLAFLLWFTGFMVIGGEWFAMWQSPTWNGQQAAFRFCMVALGVLIFVDRPDVEFYKQEMRR